VAELVGAATEKVRVQVAVSLSCAQNLQDQKGSEESGERLQGSAQHCPEQGRPEPPIWCQDPLIEEGWQAPGQRGQASSLRDNYASAATAGNRPGLAAAVASPARPLFYVAVSMIGQ
jgi:hypothetical protein